MTSFIIDSVVGSVPLWAWIAMAAGLGFVLFGIIRVYVGSWPVAFSVTFAAAAAFLTLGAVARGRQQGRLAERARNETAATRRSTARRENNDEVDHLPDADLDRRLNRWVRHDEAGQRP